ncbi:MAG: hypothetical protein Q9181_004120 [Wetmoreana brouardii]
MEQDGGQGRPAQQPEDTQIRAFDRQFDNNLTNAGQDLYMYGSFPQMVENRASKQESKAAFHAASRDPYLEGPLQTLLDPEDEATFHDNVAHIRTTVPRVNLLAPSGSSLSKLVTGRNRQTLSEVPVIPHASRIPYEHDSLQLVHPSRQNLLISGMERALSEHTRSEQPVYISEPLSARQNGPTDGSLQQPMYDSVHLAATDSTTDHTVTSDYSNAIPTGSSHLGQERELKPPKKATDDMSKRLAKAQAQSRVLVSYRAGSRSNDPLREHHWSQIDARKRSPSQIAHPERQWPQCDASTSGPPPSSSSELVVSQPDAAPGRPGRPLRQMTTVNEVEGFLASLNSKIKHEANKTLPDPVIQRRLKCEREIVREYHDELQTRRHAAKAANKSAKKRRRHTADTLPQPMKEAPAIQSTHPDPPSEDGIEVMADLVTQFGRLTKRVADMEESFRPEKKRKGAVAGLSYALLANAKELMATTTEVTSKIITGQNSSQETNTIETTHQMAEGVVSIQEENTAESISTVIKLEKEVEECGSAEAIEQLIEQEKSSRDAKTLQPPIRGVVRRRPTAAEVNDEACSFWAEHSDHDDVIDYP